MKPLKTIAFLVIAALSALPAFGDLFTITATTTDGSGISVISGNHSLIDLSQELINNTGPFRGLSGHSYNASLTYGGVPKALNFAVTQSIPPASTRYVYSARLTTPFDPGVIDRSFTSSTSQDDLYSQIKSYLKSDGASDLARFLADIDKKSPTGVLDGNPNAATALNAQQSFFEYAFAPTITEDEESSGQPIDTSHVGLALMADGGEFSSKGVHGDTYSVAPVVPFKLTDRVRLELMIPLQYTRIEGATEYGAGLQLAVPILVVKHTKGQPWTWQLTPMGGAIASGSPDLVAGGLMINGGLASYTSYRWHKWEFSLGDSVTIYHGLRVTIGDYTFDPNISQEILKNGIKVGRQLGRHWYAELYGLDTEFVSAAFIPRYATLGGGIGYRGSKNKGFIMLGAYTDLAPGYTAAKLQFGTGWKF